MTIVAAVKVYDGIVLGADSCSQIMGKDNTGTLRVLKTYHNANKLFQIKNLPIGILTYGIGNIQKKSIETLLRDFDREVEINEKKARVDEISKQVFDYFKKVYDSAHSGIPDNVKPALGFYIAGYSYNSTLGEEWEFIIPNIAPKQVRANDQFGSAWRGISFPFTRLYFGYDPRIKEQLVKAGINEGLLDSVLGQFQSQVMYDGMPVKDAIEFVKLVLRTTIGAASFEIGDPTCSGPINIAMINSKGWHDIIKNEPREGNVCE